jgi:hypothetical protein
MKYLKIGDDGLIDLSNALQHDSSIEHICLNNARISSLGLHFFCDVLKDIRCLKTLDLSCNLICNSGAIQLSKVLNRLFFLESLSLHGNRIELEGYFSLLFLFLFFFFFKHICYYIFEGILVFLQATFSLIETRLKFIRFLV